MKGKSKGNNCTTSTAEDIAKQYGVSPRTVKSDGKLAEDVVKPIELDTPGRRGDNAYCDGETLMSFFIHRTCGHPGEDSRQFSVTTRRGRYYFNGGRGPMKKNRDLVIITGGDGQEMYWGATGQCFFAKMVKPTSDQAAIEQFVQAFMEYCQANNLGPWQSEQGAVKYLRRCDGRGSIWASDTVQ